MGWTVPEHKLDEQQVDFLNNVNFEKDNVWIKGFPGSGKSVLLAYTLLKIKKNHPNASIIVVVFTHSLIKMFQAAFVEMGVAAKIVTYLAFLQSNEHYDYILSDEIQDMTPRVLKSMILRGSHVIVAGDENQSIFDSDPKYRETTVSTAQIREMLSATSFELGIIHRLPSSIINAIQRFLPSMNVFSAKRDLSKGSTQIRLCKGTSVEEEAAYIIKEGRKAINVGQTAAILVPTHNNVLDVALGILAAEGKPAWNVKLTSYGGADYNSLNRHLAENGIPVQYVGNGYGSFSEDMKKIAIMTYHSAKGLDFDNVFIPGLNRSLFIAPNERLSQTLFMVAMSRSRNNLYLTYSDYAPHQYVSTFAADCSNFNIHDYLASQRPQGGNIFGF